MQRRKFIGLTTALSAMLASVKPVSTLASSKSSTFSSGNNPMIKGMSHVGISVADMDQSVHFYRNLIGLELLGGKAGRFEGELYENIFQLKNARGKVAMLAAGNTRIELFEFENPRGDQSDARLPVYHHRINHICFEVIDIQKEYERLKTAGVYFHCPPQDAGYAKATYGRDPDGNVFELIQWVKK